MDSDKQNPPEVPATPSHGAETMPAETLPPQSDAKSDAKPDAKPDAKSARGFPGSFDQPEPRPEVMPAEGGTHPEQTAEVPLGMHGHPEPPGARGHNSPAIRRKPGDKCTQ